MRHTVAIVFPAEAGTWRSTRIEDTRLARIAEALRGAGIDVEGAPHADEVADEVRAQLLRADGALVWVNPMEDGRDRSVLNALLAEVAASGVFVSAHPDVIARMGTKEILYRTRSMEWGCDTRLYATFDALREGLPRALAEGGARVVKRERGNGGDGVWKIELAEPSRAISPDAVVRVRHAKRGSVEQVMALDEFLRQCAGYFSHGGQMIDQPYQERLREGMVRCYLVGDRVAGFGEQLVNALYPAAAGEAAHTAAQPGPREYYPPTRADFQRLKDLLERRWVAQMCELVGLTTDDLPVIWDADFLYGARDAAGNDSYVLCEINVSSVFPFPESALEPMAAATAARLAQRARRRAGS